ncbi:copper oxidase [Corynebacterium phocae]|uniref:Multicopper oxidase CueO n=1 Tax=Corynebacterium phocae TaxID=161895 RepID=A0A1L7D4T7_9CORY|nr:multicopper oxidase domain-containing protein [Corynebacterium phocae]APT92932.1 copper oxidase [Corynebacterium phocae]KAA8723264.1 multicopper oxidase domain-containing protein [Corynebacterium phocae]
MEFSRRTFFRGAVILTTSMAAGQALAACSTSGANQDQPEPLGYDTAPRPLPIPPLLEGDMDGDTRVFKLTAQDGQTEIIAGIPTTKTWGFNGPFLGPTLYAKKGDKVRAEVTNNTIEMTTVHWHGMKLPAYSDGGPHSPIELGKTWKPEWEVIQPAATVWYHPHPHLATALHAYRGLAGMFIVDDDVAQSLDIPKEYGVDDIPVVITDVKFTEDGQLDHEIDKTLGLLGTTPVVNGIANAEFTATTRRVRLRLLNGASMRFYNLVLDNGKPMQVIASDVGLLDTPQEVDEVFIGPGERVEVLIDLEPEEQVLLKSVPRKDNFGIPQDEYAADFGFQDTFDILRITGPNEGAAEPGPLPEVLDADAAATPPTTGLKEREFILNTFMINGERTDMARVDVTIDHSEPEIWKVTNENSDWPHNFHIHNARFKVIDFDTPEGVEAPVSGWKDTVDLPPKATATLLVEFAYFPDPTIPYMYHCHMLLHEDEGMMGQFVMVEPGQKADVRVQPAALAFENDSALSAHSAHGGQVIDASRSPYATPEKKA